MVELLGIWIGGNIMALIITALCAASESGNFSYVNPIVIYKNVKVNWFGASIIAILFNVGLPAVAIPYWIYKICTVGRK